MYYIIKKHISTPISTVVGFEAPKYIASKSSQNVIFEFMLDGKPTRRWINKDDVVLLTDDKEFFLKTLGEFKKLEEEQLSIINQAKSELDNKIESSKEVIQQAIDRFDKLKRQQGVPCILKEF